MVSQHQSDAAVYIRTIGGQREALHEAQDLDRPGRRLLLLVNGYTPLRLLMEMLDAGDRAGSVSALLNLVDRGLIERKVDLPALPFEEVR